MAEINLTQSDIDRFWEKVRPDPATGCYLWTASTNNKGYGSLRFGRKLMLAHRVSWLIHMGPIPDGLCVCHSCDTPLCVRHLFLGTVADNMRDMNAKGRGRIVARDRNRAKTHCKNGHPLVGTNTWINRKKNNSRICRTCNRNRMREKYRANPAAARERVRNAYARNPEAARAKNRAKWAKRKEQLEMKG